MGVLVPEKQLKEMQAELQLLRKIAAAGEELLEAEGLANEGDMHSLWFKLEMALSDYETWKEANSAEQDLSKRSDEM